MKHKKAIREQMIAQLKAMPTEQKKRVELDFYQQIIQLPQWQNAQTVALILARGFEWQTKQLIEHAWQQGKQVVVPKVLSKEQMIFVLYEHNTPLKCVKGLYEPDSTDEIMAIDCIIVPGVAFNKDGYRIGFGGGYYDRYLQQFEGYTMAMVHLTQLVEQLPIEAHDVPVQHIVLSTQ